jgi:hypothetical protein
MQTHLGIGDILHPYPGQVDLLRGRMNTHDMEETRFVDHVWLEELYPTSSQNRSVSVRRRTHSRPSVGAGSFTVARFRYGVNSLLGMIVFLRSV